MALFCTLGSFGLYTLGLRGIAASKAGVLATIEPVVATLIGVLVFHEQAGPATFAGMALIIGATLLLARRADR
jgi:drug/metabolite transporter (DMT)-like permease